MLVVKRLALILLALGLMGQSTMSPSGGIVVPPTGIVVPVTPSNISGAGAMASACPAGQSLNQIGSTSYTCINPVGVPPGSGSITDAMLANPYSGVGVCSSHTWASTLSRNAAPTCTQPGFADLVGTATDAQLANAYSGIGTCTGGQFVNALTRNGAPSCGSPAGGGGGTVTSITAGTGITLTPSPITATGSVALTTPVAIANGGTGSSTVPAAGNILVASSATVLAPVAMSGDCTIASGGAITCTKTSGVAFSALATASTPLSVANGGHGSATAPSAGQIPIAQSATSYTPNTVGGDATLSSAGSLTVTKTNGTAFTALATATIPLSIANGGRGSSTAPTTGQIDVASSATAFTPVAMSGDCTIISSGAITCTKSGGTALTSLFAPLTNPAGGQNNYAPLGSPSFTGTITFPDSSTYTSAGHNNMKALGIGQAAGGAVAGNSGYEIGITTSAAGTSPAVGLYQSNTTDATTANQVSFAMYTGTGGSIYPTSLFATGPAYPSGFSPWGANSAVLTTSEPNGLWLGTNTSPNTIKFTMAASTLGTFNTTGLNLASGLSYQINGAPIISNAGTFTPTLIGSGPAGSITYSSQIGYYTQSTDASGAVWITANYSVGWSAFSGAGGVLFLCGFPANTGLTNYYALNVVAQYSGMTFPAGFTQLLLAMSPTQTCANVNIAGSGQAPANLGVSGAAGAGSLNGTITYRHN